MAAPPLIIDTDPGVDDVLAILLALASPEVSLKALTLTFGNTTLDYAYSNVLRTGAVLRAHLSDPHTPQTVKDRYRSFQPDADRIVVAMGADHPLGGQRFTASYFHGRDGLSGVHSLPHDPFPAPAQPPLPLEATPEPACDVILSILRAHPPHTVRIAALGPLSNLALAFQKDPATFARVGRISAMGGALDVPGNTSPTAEFNFFADPWAVRCLLEDAPLHPALRGRRLPIDLVPLDTTCRHTVPYGRLVQPHDAAGPAARSTLARFVSTFLTHPRMVTNRLASPAEFHPDRHDLFQAHDPLAVAHAIFAPSDSEAQRAAGWSHALRRFRIECGGEHTRGMCVVDRRGYDSAREGTNKAHDHREPEVRDLPDQPPVEEPRLESQQAVGLVSVLTDTPGVDWFAQMFLERLGL